jgi:hypothetical protein
LLEIGTRGDVEQLGIALGIAVVAGWLAPLAVPLALASAGVAGFVLFRVSPPLAAIALPWAVSLGFLARTRSAIPRDRRFAAELATSESPTGTWPAAPVISIRRRWCSTSTWEC